MSTMIQRIAVAIAESDNVVWGDCGSRMTAAYLAGARAALVTMREPTDAMINTQCGDYMATEKRHIFNRMIDVALGEGK